MEINNTKLKHTSLTLKNNFYATKTNLNQVLRIFSQEHNHQTLTSKSFKPTKRRE